MISKDECNKNDQTGKKRRRLLMQFISTLHLKPYKKLTLKNGIEVYTIEAGAGRSDVR